MNTPSAARPVWLLIGLASLGCGMAGVVLPLIPATPFLLLAAYAFARSSPRLHEWLISHRQFGPIIENWRQHRGIDRRTKVVAVLAIALTFAISWLVGAAPWVLGVQAVVLTGVAAIIVTRPEGPTNAQDEP